MITVPTVLVLGAGASHSYNYPLGEVLYNEVLSLDHARVIGEDADKSKIDKFQMFTETMKYSGYYSVDYFLEQRPEFSDVGKAAIARVLASKEGEQFLFNGPSDHWYKQLLNVIDDRESDLSHNRLTIVTYNYDISLEYYLTKAIATRRQIEVVDAAIQLQGIPILHLHGSIGTYPPEFHAGRIYGSTNENMREAARLAPETIKIITDADPNAEVFDIAENSLREAGRVYFLGFGFAPQNLRRLRVFNEAWTTEDRHKCLVNGTVQGIPRTKWQRVAEKDLGRSWSTSTIFGGSIFAFFRDECDLEAEAGDTPLAFQQRAKSASS